MVNINKLTLVTPPCRTKVHIKISWKEVGR
nr:MAG TPA: hypothetical protein [Caudoviricetes sp.]